VLNLWIFAICLLLLWWYSNIHIVYKKVKLSDLTDEELENNFSEVDCFLIKQNKSLNKATNEFKSLLKFFQDHNDAIEKNAGKIDIFQISFIIDTGSTIIKNAANLLDTAAQNKKNLKKLLKKKSWNEVSQALVDPVGIYYTISLLKLAKENIENKHWNCLIPLDKMKVLSDNALKLADRAGVKS
jgi:hypothetical protein